MQLDNHIYDAMGMPLGTERRTKRHSQSEKKVPC